MAILLCIYSYMVSSVRKFYILKEEEKFMNSFVFPIFIQWLGLRIDRFFSIIWLRFLIFLITNFSYIFSKYNIFMCWSEAEEKKPIKLELLYSLLNTWHFNISSVNQFIMWCNKLFWTASKLFNSITLGFFF